MFKKSVISFFLLMVLVGVNAQESSQRLPQLSDYEITKALEAREIADFQLTEALLDKMERVQTELADLPIEAEEDTSGDDITVGGLVRAIEARPAVMAVLARYELTVRNYVVGAMALSNALLATVAEEESGEEEASSLIFSESSAVSSENLAFGKKYADRIRALLGG